MDLEAPGPRSLNSAAATPGWLRDSAAYYTPRWQKGKDKGDGSDGASSSDSEQQEQQRLANQARAEAREAAEALLEPHVLVP